MIPKITSATAEVWIASRLPSALIAEEEAEREGLPTITPSESDVQALMKIAQNSHENSKLNSPRLEMRELGSEIQMQRTLDYLEAKPQQINLMPEQPEISGVELCRRLREGVRAFAEETKRLNEQKMVNRRGVV